MEQDTQLLPRDKLLRDTFTPAETSLFGLVLVTANVAFWLAEPRSYWLLGFFLIAAALTPVILKTHEHTHPFFVTLLWPKFWLCTAPVWLLLLQFSLGLLQDPLKTITVGDAEFIQFEMPGHVWLPISTTAETAWPTVFGFSAIYIVAIGLFLVPKSRAFFERLMPYLCLSAVLAGLVGYIQEAMNASKPFLTKGTGMEDFFGYFPYDGHWAAFAAIWTCACISMALLTTRYDDSPPFIESSGPWYLTGGTLLGVSAFLIESKWPAVILLLTYAVMMMFFGINFFSIRRDPHRKVISLFSSLVSFGIFAAAFTRMFQGNGESLVSESLKQGAWEMFRDRPIFGWGMDSYAHLLPYYGSDLLVNENYERAGNDVLQLLAEIGIIGFVFPIILVVCLIGRYLKGRHNIQLTNHFLTGLAAVIVLAFFDSPFMSPAVFYSFVTLLFIALRWADISRNRADEVDASRPQLVTPHSLRRVPFHPVQENDKLR
ncbi:hypothetical protein DDZ13_05060 [Coraliomargarita sinensis]|uniref:O-antigen ligase-related domain-containing protein n=1 Tax=Coraliomargarita sinensis TaxID=2174842 RepID=A0A317ZKT2_9BACT|nr:O-antigen ligase family protein [Coraliomargarita sinensis]PXA04548.1 hypothetical protein DDZ13_05060 [Coraliomargarita sinensis]